MRAALLFVLCSVALVSAQVKYFAGDFSSVDSLNSRNFAAFTPSGGPNYPNGQFVSVSAFPTEILAGTFGSGATPRAYADDGSVFGIGAGNPFAGAIPGLSELFFYDNSTSTNIQRLFGFNGFFGFDSPPPTQFASVINPRTNTNYFGTIQAIEVIGASPSRQLAVCFQAPAGVTYQRLLVGNQPLNNPSTAQPTPTPLAPQLVVFSEGASFLSTSTTVNNPPTTAPQLATIIYSGTGFTSDNQPGVDCSSLIAGGSTVMIRVTGGGYYINTNIGSAPTQWTLITRDTLQPANLPAPLFGHSKNVDLDVVIVAGAGSGTSPDAVYLYVTNPNNLATTPSQSDFYQTIYKWGGGIQWTPVLPPNDMQNVSVSQYVIGSDGAAYFTLAPITNIRLYPPFLLPQNFGNPFPYYLPVEQYVLSSKTPASGGSYNYLLPLQLIQVASGSSLSLHWDINLDTLIVWGPGLSGVVIGDQINFKKPDDDHRYYSKDFVSALALDASGAQWIQAYGGGFDGAVTNVISRKNGFTYIEGGFTFVFQTYSGPIASYDSTNGVWGGVGVTTVGLADIDGGDMHGMFGGYAVVYDIVEYTSGTTNGLIAVGEFRTADGGQTICNSICFFPFSSGPKTNFVSANGFYTAAGVRNQDGSGPAAVPEHQQYYPGTILSVGVDSSNTIYVGGVFQIAGDGSASNFAYFNGAWNNAQGGVNGAVYSVLVMGSTVYVGGSFNAAGNNVLTKNVGAWDITNQVWRCLNRGLEGTVFRLINYGGKLLAVGSFTSGSGQYLPNIGLWDGSSWKPLPSTASGGCQQYYCSPLQIPGVSGVLDAYEYNGLLYLALSYTNGSVALGAWYGAGTGYGLVDSDAWSLGAPAFDGNAQGSAANVNDLPGAQYLVPGTASNNLWLLNSDESNILGQPAKRVAAYDVSLKNFVTESATGWNSFVYSALPKSTSAASALVASLLCCVFAALLLAL